ncbi:MAG: Cytochrome b-c1 complex subunit 7 [Trizodia sp. TS-e1964]|nr:MAG: Cytochrome b-c1 complex subunit 7 [Trizodia sp. TS-e1964]
MSIVNFIVKRPWLRAWIQPMADWADDLIPEESETVLLALKRLPPKEAYDRVFRLRRAFQCSLAHQLLPADQHTPPDEDVPYLSKIIAEIEAEKKERADLDNLVMKRRI